MWQWSKEKCTTMREEEGVKKVRCGISVSVERERVLRQKLSTARVGPNSDPLTDLATTDK